MTKDQERDVSTGSNGGATRQPGIPEPARSQLLAALDASIKARALAAAKADHDVARAAAEAEVRRLEASRKPEPQEAVDA